MLQNVLPGENSGQNSCFLRAKSSIFHEQIGSGIILVPKSRFYRFYMDFGTQNDLLLVTLGLLWFPQGDLGGRLGAQIDAKLEIFIKNAPNLTQSHENNLQKLSKWPPKVIKTSTKMTWTLISVKPRRKCKEIKKKIGGTREALRNKKTNCCCMFPYQI